MTSARRFVLPPNVLDDVRDRLDGDGFVYCRESPALTSSRGQRMTGSDVAFGPDRTFAFDRADIGAATRLLDSPDLESDPANTLTSHEEMGCNQDFFGGAFAAVPVRGLRRQSRWL